MEDELLFAYNSGKTGCLLLVFVLEACKKFCNKKYLNSLEEVYSLVDEKESENFIKNIKALKIELQSYQKWFAYLGYTIND